MPTDHKGITDSDWDRLPEDDRVEWLRNQFNSIRGSLDAGNVAQLHLADKHENLAVKVEQNGSKLDAVAEDLSTNTEVTRRVADSVEKIVDAFKHLTSFFRVLEWMSKWSLKVVAPVGIVGAACVAGVAWLRKEGLLP